MAKIQLRSSVLAVKVESSEGVAAEPASGSDVVATQADFSITPAFSSLKNDELRSSIGSSKPIQGIENPTASLSHYVRASGVEGQAPNYDAFLQSAFGAKTTVATERSTAASSTTSDIKVGSGIGANFERGLPVMVKDATNGYSIRCIHSVSGDDLTPSFALAAAPASGVKLGKGILYKPVSVGHPTLTIKHYMGNGGGVQLLTGVRVSGVDIDIKAGDLIKGSIKMDGIQYSLNPVVTTASTIFVDWTDDAGTHAASVVAKYYRSPKDLASALQAAMQAQTTTAPTVTYSDSTGKFTLTATGVLFTIKWNTGTNTANSIASVIGFSTAADSTGALTYTSATALNFAFPFTASYDNADPVAAKNHECLLGDGTSSVVFNASSLKVSIKNSRATQPSVCAPTGVSGSLFTERAVDLDVSALLDANDVDKFDRYLNNTSTRFQYSFGNKTGGNWVPGQCGVVYLPQAVVSSFTIDAEGGQAAIKLKLTAFVDATGAGEVYLGFL